MEVEQIDLIQLHNLTKDVEWDIAFGENGAVKAALEAKRQGLVRFIGVTGHGTRVAEMHLKSLREFEFDSVLLPYSYMSLQDSRYAEEFDQLCVLAKQRNFAVQTIKSIARRRWREDDESKRFSWYEPVREEAAITRAVHFVLKRPGLFLNSSSDATLLKIVLEAARNFDESNVEGLDDAVAHDAVVMQQEPLFVRGQSDDVRA
jgi:aryl-alcohol dehydrogenase-like predicted oxidoreductase